MGKLKQEAVDETVRLSFNAGSFSQIGNAGKTGAP
jgi:hypothetical protein